MDTKELQDKLLGLMNGEFSHLSIDYNQHAYNYITVKQAIEDGLYEHVDWVSEEEKQRAMFTNSAWVVHCYPHTPVGFWALAASTLEACLAAAFNQE